MAAKKKIAVRPCSGSTAGATDCRSRPKANPAQKAPTASPSPTSLVAHAAPSATATAKATCSSATCDWRTRLSNAGINTKRSNAVTASNPTMPRAMIHKAGRGPTGSKNDKPTNKGPKATSCANDTPRATCPSSLLRIRCSSKARRISNDELIAKQAPSAKPFCVDRPNTSPTSATIEMVTVIWMAVAVPTVRTRRPIATRSMSRPKANNSSAAPTDANEATCFSSTKPMNPGPQTAPAIKYAGSAPSPMRVVATAKAEPISKSNTNGPNPSSMRRP